MSPQVEALVRIPIIEKLVLLMHVEWASDGSYNFSEFLLACGWAFQLDENSQLAVCPFVAENFDVVEIQVHYVDRMIDEVSRACCLLELRWVLRTLKILLTVLFLF